MKTTIKVEASTRDLVREISGERSLDFDETIRLGMTALRREQRREQMRRESAALSQDPTDLAEAQAVLQDMEAWGAG